MVDLPDYTPQTATAEIPDNRVTEGAVVRNAEAIPEGLNKLGEGLDKLAVPIAQQEGVEAAQKVQITRAPDGSLNVANPQTSFIVGEAGDAYADAVSAGTLAKYHAQMDTDMAGLAQQYKGNAPGFQTAAHGYLQNLQSAGDPISAHAADYGADLAAQHYAGIVDRVGAIDVATSKAALESRQDYLENAMNGLAADGGAATPQYQQMARERASIIATRTANPLFGYSKDMASVDDDNFHNGLTAAAAVGAARRLYNATGDLGASVTMLNDQIGKLPISEAEKLKLTGEVSEHMRGLDAVRQQQNEDLRASSETAITLALSTHKFDPSQFSDLSAQLRGRRMYAQAAKVDTTGLFLQYWPAMSGADAGQAEAAHQAFLSAVQKRQGALIGRAPTPIEVSGTDRDLEIRTIYGEARGEPEEGQAAVAAVIRNRVQSGKYGTNLDQILKASNQFTVWNPGDPNGPVAEALRPDDPEYQRIGKIVDDINGGKRTSPIGGAENYYNPAAASPQWGPTLAQQNDVVIGNHRFVGGVPGSPAGAAEVQPVIASYVTAAQKIFNDRARQLWDPMKAALDKGQMPSAQEFADLKTLSPDVTDPDLLKGIRDALGVAQKMETFKTLPLDQQQDMAASMQVLATNGGLDNIQRTLAGQMQAQVDHMKNLAANDPVSYFALRARPDVQKGLGDPFGYDVTNAASLAQGLKAGQAYKNAAHALDPSVTNDGVMPAVKRDQLAAAMPAMSPQQVTGTLQALAGLRPKELDAEMGVKSTSDAIVGLTRSGDPQKMSAAFGFMDQYYRRDPLSFAQNFGNEALLALKGWQAQSAYKSPDQIAKDSMTADDPNVIAAKAHLRDVAKKALNGTSRDDYEVSSSGIARTTSADVLRKIGGASWATPDVGSIAPAQTADAIRQDYVSLFAEGYAQTKNKDLADQYATERLQQKYSVSSLNNSVMAYAPDREGPNGGLYYPKINGGFDWMRDDLDKTVKQFVGPMEPAHPTTEAGELGVVTPETPAQQKDFNVYNAPRYIISDATTAAEIAAKRPPSYQIAVQDRNGSRAVLSDPASGLPMRWRPDPKPYQAQFAADFAAQNRVAGERAEGLTPGAWALH